MATPEMSGPTPLPIEGLPRLDRLTRSFTQDLRRALGFASRSAIPSHVGESGFLTTQTQPWRLRASMPGTQD